MRTAKFIASVAIGTLLAAPAMASNDGVESNNEIQNTYRHEYSDDKVPEWAEQERERHTERNRLQKHMAEGDAGGLKLKAQNRYQHQERNQVSRDGGGFGRSGSSGPGAAGASAGSGAGKGSNGRN